MASLESYCSFLYLLIVQQLLLFTVITAQPNLFQCQTSSDNKLVYTPNISGSYFNAMETARLRVSHNLTDTANLCTYIFTIHPDSQNCSGTVRSIEYYYRVRSNVVLNLKYNVSNFLMLSQNGARFKVMNRVSIQTTPQNNICIEDKKFEDISHICCDKAVLNDSDQFNVPSLTYAYGVQILNSNVRPFLLRRSHQIRQYYVTYNSTDMNSQQLNATESSSKEVILLRFFTTLNGSSSSINGKEPNSNNRGGSNQENSNTDSSNKGSENSTRRESDNRNKGNSSGDSNENRGSNKGHSRRGSNGKRSSKFGRSNGSSTITTIVGGAIGGFVALAIPVTIMVCVVVVIVVKYRSKKHCKTCENSGARFENVLYQEVSEIESSIPPAKHVGNRALICNSIHEYEVLIEEEEDLYVVPAQTEDALHDQLRDNLNIQYIVRNSVRLGDELGSGQFGVVYKGVLQSRGGGGGGMVDVAVKTLKEGSGEEDRVKFLQEAAIMGQFKHHNVVTMYGVVAEIEQVLLVLELLPKGDLRSHLLHMKSDEEGEISVDDHTLLSYCRQVASGMAYLSNKAFVHRDLASRNILVSEDGICKIADFGMSRDLMDESYYVSHGGIIPVKWTAPEVSARLWTNNNTSYNTCDRYYKKYSTASDVWSYGVLMYEIWSVGHKPYEEHESKEVIKLIDSGFRLPPPPGCPRALYTIMMSCWHPITSDRPTFLDITQQLSLPDPRLLKWSEEDKSVHPEAAKLGADLLCAQDLYKDLQMKYHAK